MGHAGVSLEKIDKNLGSGNQLAGSAVKVNRKLTISEKVDPVAVPGLNPRGLPQNITFVRMEGVFEVPIEVVETEKPAKKGKNQEPEEGLSKNVSG